FLLLLAMPVVILAQDFTPPPAETEAAATVEAPASTAEPTAEVTVAPAPSDPAPPEPVPAPDNTTPIVERVLFFLLTVVGVMAFVLQRITGKTIEALRDSAPAWVGSSIQLLLQGGFMVGRMIPGEDDEKKLTVAADQLGYDVEKQG